MPREFGKDGEIGLNMMLVESGDDLVAIDCGVMFPDDEMLGIDRVTLYNKIRKSIARQQR